MHPRSGEYFASLWMMMLKEAEAKWHRRRKKEPQSKLVLPVLLRTQVITISECLKNMLIFEITGLVITFSNKSVKSGWSG